MINSDVYCHQLMNRQDVTFYIDNAKLQALPVTRPKLLTKGWELMSHGITVHLESYKIQNEITVLLSIRIGKKIPCTFDSPK